MGDELLSDRSGNRHSMMGVCFSGPARLGPNAIRTRGPGPGIWHSGLEADSPGGRAN